MKNRSDNKVKRSGKGGRLSLLIALVLMLAAVALAAMHFLAYPQLEPVKAAVVKYAAIAGETISPAVLAAVLSLVVFTSRRRRPFNYVFLPMAVVFYYTLLCAVHLMTGDPEPAFLMSRVSSTRTSLVILLAVLEVLVSVILAIINSSLNGLYRKHRAKKDALAAKKAELEAGQDAVSKPSRRDLKRQEKEARKARRLAEKQAAKAARGRKGATEADGKSDVQDHANDQMPVDEVSIGTATPDPASPISFPETLHVPEFDTIPRGEDHVISADVQPRPAKDPDHIFGVHENNVISMSALENSARNVERMLAEQEAKKKPETSTSMFRKGGMLESAIEATSRPVQGPSGPNPNPIIGYSDRRRENVKQTTSFAPSNLSPDHPRYKLFESLRRRNDAQSPAAQEVDVTHFPSRTFSPSSAPAEEEKGGVSINLKSRPVEEATAVHEAMASQPVPEPVEPAPVPVSKTPVEMPRAQHHAKKAETEAPQPFIGEEEDILDDEDERPAEAPAPEPAPVRPAASRVGSVVKPAHHESAETKAEEVEENSSQIEFKVGISGLESNNEGEKAIIRRQRRSYNPPSPDLLQDFPQTSYEVGDVEMRTGQLIASVMHDFRVEVELADIVKGPTVTLYEYTLAPGVLVSKVMNLEKNIAMRIGGQMIRILAPVPGKSAVGIEVPNAKRVTVGFKELLDPLKKSNLSVPMILGRDIQGDAKLLDVAKCPHLLIAGTTGSGKSVCINGLVASILYTKSPKDVRLIMVDPKVVELNVYNGIPHLLTPVITEPKRVLKMLNWLVEEMERRFRVFGQCGARNIEGFNSRIREFGYATEKMPYIVLIMDEFADLMTVIGKDIEDYIRRLMAKARAAGIHVVMATQRPSAEVVTGTIKNNIPTRIAFAASSVVNSRIILDEAGAENLLGKGDMLLSTQSTSGLTRIQGAFLSDEEVDKIVSFVKTQGEPDYLDEAIFEDEPEPESCDFPEDDEGSDADLYEKAKQICFERKGASASYLQRRLSIGYNRAARLVEQMEDEGIVGPANGSKPREILRYE